MGFFFSQSTLCVCWFELFSRVSDVAHGPLVRNTNIHNSIDNEIAFDKSIIKGRKQIYWWSSFAGYRSCIFMIFYFF